MSKCDEPLKTLKPLEALICLECSGQGGEGDVNCTCCNGRGEHMKIPTPQPAPKEKRKCSDVHPDLDRDHGGHA